MMQLTNVTGCIRHAQDALSNDDADFVAEQPSSVSPEMLAAIKLAIKDVVGTQLANIGKELTQLVQINERTESVEHTMQATNYRLENVITMMLPTIAAHMSHLAEALARRQLELKVHRQKWNLVMHIIQGDTKKDWSVTRQTCMQFAKTVLKVLDAETTACTACHRLSQKPNAGIILRFMDLAQRDSWISGAKHLKNYSGMVPISPDTPTPTPTPITTTTITTTTTTTTHLLLFLLVALWRTKLWKRSPNSQRKSNRNPV